MTTLHLIHGGHYNFDEPAKSVYDIHILAHSLARVCRFGGHITCPHYSVAQHSVAVSLRVPPKYQLLALLHDASDFVLGDQASPVKSLLPDYRGLEGVVSKEIYERFAIPREFYFPQMAAEIKRADRMMKATERRDLLPPSPVVWEELDGIAPSAGTIDPWDPEYAEVRFLLRYYEIKNPENAP